MFWNNYNVQVFKNIVSDWKDKPNTKINEIDGLHIDTPDWWVHLRKSNTEPIVRVIAEGRTLDSANEIANQFMDFVKKNKS